MVNLEEFTKRTNRYGGSEAKDTYYKDGKYYLIKKPDIIREKNNSLSYMNNVFSEYISCHIFKEIGIPVQNTELSMLKENGKEKIVCVCEDFTDEKHTLIEFGKQQNETEEIGNSKNLKSKELNIYKILDSINSNNLIKNKEETIEKFWQIFIVDALIYNKDRHNENWGYLENKDTGEITMAPVYDCGSSLLALKSESECIKYLESSIECKNVAVNCTSAMRDENGKIVYYSFLNSLSNPDCNKALINIYPRIDIEKINDFIDKILYISDTYKSFYKKIIKTSYELVLTPAYKSLQQK